MMRNVRRIAALSLLMAAAALLGLGAHDARSQGPATVTVGEFFFCEEGAPPGSCATTVNAGETVVWDYPEGSAGHTVTHCGDSCDEPTDSPLFDSGGIDPGGTFSFTFQGPGTFLYRCDFHPDAMRASVVVQGDATPTPQASPTATQPPTPTPEPAEPTPTTAPSPVATPADAASEAGGDDDGVSAWWFALAGVVAAAVLLGGGLVLWRLRG